MMLFSPFLSIRCALPPLLMPRYLRHDAMLLLCAAAIRQRFDTVAHHYAAISRHAAFRFRHAIRLLSVDY